MTLRTPGSFARSANGSGDWPCGPRGACFGGVRSSTGTSTDCTPGSDETAFSTSCRTWAMVSSFSLVRTTVTVTWPPVTTISPIRLIDTTSTRVPGTFTSRRAAITISGVRDWDMLVTSKGARRRR